MTPKFEVRSHTSIVLSHTHIENSMQGMREEIDSACEIISNQRDRQLVCVRSMQQIQLRHGLMSLEGEAPPFS